MTTRTAGILPLSLGTAVLGGVVLLTGCTGDPQPEPTSVPATTSVAPSPQGTSAVPPSSEELTVPEPLDGEIARAVHTLEGADGVPETRSEALDIPREGVMYTVEGSCVGVGARFAVELREAAVDRDNQVVLNAEGPCNGDAVFSQSMLLPEIPMQLSIVSTDGVISAWARVAPTDG